MNHFSFDILSCVANLASRFQKKLKCSIFHRRSNLWQVATLTIYFFRFSMDMEIGHVYDRHSVLRSKSCFKIREKIDSKITISIY